jgi:excisionase family DNA binding protein
MEISLTFEKLPEAVAELFRKLERIESLLLESAKKSITPERMTAPEAAAYLNIALPTLYGLVSKRQIKHMKAGKKLTFFRHELDEYLNNGRRLTVDEMAAKMKRRS